MSDNHDYLNPGSGTTRLRADALLLMLKGAGYAFLFCMALWLTFAVLAGIGRMLPEESRETEDPTPVSFMVDPAQSPVRHIA